MQHHRKILLISMLWILLGIPVMPTAAAQDGEEDASGADEAASTESTETGNEEQESSETIDAIKGRFLAAPVIITEPAIGKGLGAGLIYFHGTKATDRPRVQSGADVANTGRRSNAPPTATAVGAFYTSNETAGIAAGHSRSFAEDRYRTVGVFASAEINATFYQSNEGFDFGLDMNAAYARIQRRMGDSDVFLGLSAMWMDGDIGFETGDRTNLPPSVVDFPFTDVGIAGMAIYDSRDDSMMPGTGQLYDLTIARHDDAFGSDFDYTNTRIKILSFHELHEKFHLGLRFDVSQNNGEAPFFMIPYVSLRGIPALRYQGEAAGAVELEGRYDISPRWAAVAFTGAGFVSTDDPLYDDPDNIFTVGAGIRYQLFKEQNVWVGLDIAEGPEESNWYVQIGHPW